VKTLLRLALCFGPLLLVTSCSTPASRISKNQEEFFEWPVAVQEKIRAGEIDLGFTPEQVQMALGKPDRVATRTDHDGVGEVWSYPSKRPHFSFGVGVGTSSGHTSTGVGVATGTDHSDETMRIVFAGGRVSAIETPTKRR
jgi:hypothetical protein